MSMLNNENVNDENIKHASSNEIVNDENLEENENDKITELRRQILICGNETWMVKSSLYLIIKLRFRLIYLLWLNLSVASGS